MIKMPAVHFWRLSSWRFDLHTYFHSFPRLRERFVVRFNASNDTNFQKLQQEKKQSTFTEAQHVSFSYIVLMRPRNVEVCFPLKRQFTQELFPKSRLKSAKSPLPVDMRRLKTSLLKPQQCWELLRLCWQWCANGCINNQQCWGVVASVLAVVCKRMQQHTNNVGSCCVRVGIGVQTDPKTPNNVGTCSALWEGYNSYDSEDHV